MIIMGTAPECNFYSTQKYGLFCIAVEDGDRVVGILADGEEHIVAVGDQLVVLHQLILLGQILGPLGVQIGLTAKCAAGHLNKPIFAFPTLASNCASCTTLCVMYYPDGAMRDLYYPKRCAIHTFMDSEIIANSPAEYVWAGIGDSLAKEFESEFAARNDLAAFKIQHAPLMGTAIAKCCTSAFLHYGEKAMEQIRNHVDGYELQQVTLGIVITAGMVSNLTVETVKNEYFYNDSIAHGFYYGCTVCPGAHKHLHGELVSMGILVLLTLDKQFETRDRLFPFYKALGLPMTMEAIELPESDLPTLVDKAATMDNWHYVPTPITKERFTQAILDTDKAAKAWLAANK